MVLPSSYKIPHSTVLKSLLNPSFTEYILDSQGNIHSVTCSATGTIHSHSGLSLGIIVGVTAFYNSFSIVQQYFSVAHVNPVGCTRIPDRGNINWLIEELLKTKTC